VIVRLKDIARDLGVSTVTVSKALRNHVDISEATKERVRARMKELNYRPNLAARGLITGRTCIVGLVVPDLVHAFFSELAKGLSSVLRQNGYGLILSSSEEDPGIEKEDIEQMLARRVDALLVASCQTAPEGLHSIQERGTPYILIDRRFNGHTANFVGNDDELIGEIATEHLVGLGRTRIAHIAGPQVSTSKGRSKGYRKVLSRHRVKAPEEYIVTLSTGDVVGHIAGFHAMKKLLAARPCPDGVFCYNDPAAVGAMRAIIEAGLKIPEDVAVVGCGNLPYSSYLRVPLTSVDQGSYRLGEEAARLALANIRAKKALRPKSVLLTPKLVVRQSTQGTGNGLIVAPNLASDAGYRRNMKPQCVKTDDVMARN